MKEKELLFSITKDDFEIERTKGSGKGGQNRNKRETAIRLTHKASGIQSYCADERSQDQNLKKAFKTSIILYVAFGSYTSGRERQDRAESPEEYPEGIQVRNGPIPPILIFVYVAFVIWSLAYLIFIGIQGGPF